MITLDDMKSNLLTSDEVLEKLGSFEPFSVLPVDKGEKIEFRVDPEWALNIDTLEDTDQVDATVIVAGNEVPLSKEAFFQIAVQGGLPAATVKRVPYDATQTFLNRVYRTTTKDMKIIRVGDTGAAFAPATLTPFSNVQLAENVLEAINEHYGKDTEVYADYKITNTLSRTDVRFIIGDSFHIMRDTEMPDVPKNSSDYWTSGVHLSNSLVGSSQTFVDSYMFRWWCTNGCTTQNTTVGNWDRRRSANDPDSVYDWARDAVNEVLGGMEHRFAQIQSLNDLEITDPALVVDDIFARFNLPARQRQHILETVATMPRLTMYSLMQSITSAANEAELAAKDVERLLRIGGVLYADATLSPQKARIWDAGHFAPSGAPNPFNMR